MRYTIVRVISFLILCANQFTYHAQGTITLWPIISMVATAFDLLSKTSVSPLRQ